MSELRAILFGVGAVGSLIAKHLLDKGVRVVGAVDTDKNKTGKDLGEVLNLTKKLGLVVSEDVDSVLSGEKCDVAIHATSSSFRRTYPQIASIVRHGVDVVSTCEELSFPYYSEPDLAKDLDKLSKRHEATVLGTGINPGFLMDTLVITLTAVCQRIERISVSRVMDAATRRIPFQRKVGAGLKVGEFREAMDTGLITGHVGLTESIAMIADALSWNLDGIVAEQAEPVIAGNSVRSGSIDLRSGCVAGMRQKAAGYRGGNPVISLDFQAYIGAKEESDSIVIVGMPNVRQRIAPCVHGDLGTVAIVVNSIPKVIGAPPGLVTMKDLPVPSAWNETFNLEG